MSESYSSVDDYFDHLEANDVDPAGHPTVNGRPTLDYEPDDEPVDLEQPQRPVDPDFVKEPKQSRGSKEYEAKVADTLRTVAILTAASPETVADSAAILTHGPKLSRAIGDLTDEDPRVKKIVDFIAGGTNNPYANVAAAAAPLLLQVLRNHEPRLEVKPRGIRIPFTKRTIHFKFGIKLGRLKLMTKHPRMIESNVFDDPTVAAQLTEAGWVVARSAKH